jgi:hypothetical protein
MFDESILDTPITIPRIEPMISDLIRLPRISPFAYNETVK